MGTPTSYSPCVESRCARRGKVTDNELDRGLRYRNYAEELRLIAAEGATPEARQSLLFAAQQYDQMAARLESLERAKITTGLRPKR